MVSPLTSRSSEITSQLCLHLPGLVMTFTVRHGFSMALIEIDGLPNLKNANGDFPWLALLVITRPGTFILSGWPKSWNCGPHRLGSKRYLYSSVCYVDTMHRCGFELRGCGKSSFLSTFLRLVELEVQDFRYEMTYPMTDPCIIW